MSKKWYDISDDELLDFEGGGEGMNARYNRIMQNKSIKSTLGLRDKLTGLIETIYRANQGLKDKTDEVIARYDEFSSSQSRQQILIIILSSVITVSTITYTWITWKSVTAMREANQIQREFLAIEQSKLEAKKTPKHAINRTEDTSVQN